MAFRPDSAQLFCAFGKQIGNAINAKSIADSLLTKEEVWQEVCHVLIELILRGQQHRLVVNEQQQQVEEEKQHDAGEHHQDSRDAVLLGNDTCFGVQWLQQVRQTCANAIALWQWVTLSIGCRLLGISDREVALWGLHRHTHLAVLAGRVHEGAAQGPDASAGCQHKPYLIHDDTFWKRKILHGNIKNIRKIW